jgi:hypothetical protein
MEEALDAGEWPVSSAGLVISDETDPLWIGDWAGLRAGSDGEEKNSASAGNQTPII